MTPTVAKNLAHLLFILNELRLKRDLSVVVWAQLAGVNHESVGRYLRGQAVPGATVIWKLMAALDVEMTIGDIGATSAPARRIGIPFPPDPAAAAHNAPAG